MFTKDQPPSAMQIQSAIDKVLVEIEHIDAHSPHVTLGYIITPSGKHAELYALVEKYVDDWVTHVQSSNLYPHEKILSYHTVLVPQVAYRLVGASFSYDECDELMKKKFPILINAYGFHRSFSRAMATAPYTYAGLNITHLYDLQGQCKLRFFMLHMKRQDSTGTLLKIALRYMQQSIGFADPFYNRAYKAYDHLLPPSWTKHLLQFLDSRRITIEITDDIKLLYPRKKDRSITDLLSAHFTRDQMRILNRYRVFLQAMYISEISDISGKFILPNIVSCIQY